MKYRQVIFALIVLMSLVGHAQDINRKSYSLDECISIALENNLDLKSANLRANSTKINHQQSKANLLPSVNGDFNIGVNDGRSIDPFTNDFINQELTFSNARLNLDAIIFNGFRLINTVRQERLNRQASEQETDEAKQNLILEVTLAYLQVLNNRDVLELAKKRLDVTNNQLQRQEEIYREEVGNPADYTDIKAQKTLDETNILNLESALNNSKLNLRRLLNLDENIYIETIDLLINFERYELSSEDVFNDALNSLATIKAKETRVEAAKKGISIAKAQFTPQISAFAGLNTNYSSLAETFSATGSNIIETGDFVTINNQDTPVLREQTVFNSNKISYKDQFDNNLSTVVGVSVNLPLFNGFRAKNNVALEKIKFEESLIELDRTRQEIKNTIDQVYFDMNASYMRYQSLVKQVEAFNESYRINEVRFNNGVSNFLAYITSKNNFDNAKTNLANAKYEYLLLVKILEYYRGNF
ncbi:TolC family protein [Flavobacteriaceae bacterium S0825]|uniref:TolC family protein n=1 Tax=Gaetbulibacter sp. S0825 TaxID=2720084 RepID=UPI001FCB993B|nr:TolC family protein [Gaetbulibacter sp. S0825]MCK0109987.1 TolC family protein [Flavobacteriaceae bacterium S0825]